MELENKEQIQAAVKDSTYVVHTAAYVTNDIPKDESKIVDPTVNGCLEILKNASKYGVRRVIITSSLASICGIDPIERPETFNETFWTDLSWEGLKSPYEKAKTIAELKSWNFIKNLPSTEHRPELVTICPGFITGPCLSLGSSKSTSISSIK